MKMVIGDILEYYFEADPGGEDSLPYLVNVRASVIEVCDEGVMVVVIASGDCDRVPAGEHDYVAFDDFEDKCARVLHWRSIR